MLIYEFLSRREFFMNSNYISIAFLNEIPLFDRNFSLIKHEFEQWNQEYEAFNFEFNGVEFKSRLAKKLLKNQVILLRFGARMKLIKTDLLILTNQKIS